MSKLPTQTLGEVVSLRKEKCTGKKSENSRYLGLEHFNSECNGLNGYAPATISDGTNSIFCEGDILFGKLRPNLRKCARAPFDGYCSTDVLVLNSRDSFNPDFVAHMMKQEAVFACAEQTAIGTKMPRTSWRHLNKIELFCPEDPAEQRRIAEILDTADAAIQKTEALIAKLKKMKAGLLHDLLTRGIDENGELRRSPSEAPNLYQPSPLGPVPKAWDIETGQSLSMPITKGTTPKVMYGRDETSRVPYLRVQNLAFDGTLAFEKDTLFIDRSVHENELKRSKVYPGDVLMNLVGPPLGKISIVPQTHPEWNLNQAIAIFRSLGRCSPKFLSLHLQSHRSMKWLLTRSRKTSGQQNLTLDMCRQLPVPIPKAPLEQTAICDRFYASDDRIAKEGLVLSKLRNLKAGLMHDLLTGNKRVDQPVAASVVAG